MKLKAYMRCFYVLLFTFFSFNVFAQQKQRVIVGGYTPKPYVDYKVTPQETFASIASIYNISPDTLSEFNNIDYYEGPLFAKTLKIPLNAQNFTQKGIADSSEVLVPVYHMVNGSETLQQIMVKAGKLPLTTIKKWNIIPPTGIVKGMPVLVGFLKAKPQMLAYFEDTASAEFARVEKPAPPKAVKPETKVDSSAVAANNARKNENRKVVAKDSIDNKKLDTIAVAVNTPKKSTAKKDVVKPKVENKTDTSSVVLNNPVKTNNKKDKAKGKLKTDTSSVALNVETKTEPGKDIAKQRIENKSDSLALAANNPTKAPAKKDKPKVKPKVEPKVDSSSNTASADRIRNEITKPKIDSNAVVASNKKSTTKKPGAKAKEVKVDSTAKTADRAIASNTGENPKNDSKTPAVVLNTDNKKVVEQNTTEENPKEVTKTEVVANGTADNTNITGNETTTGSSTNNVAANKVEEITFEGIFNEEMAIKPGKQLTGEASYFESRSGWNDQKYYVLMPHVAAGTIVKITTIENKSIFAKVLGTMPEMKENQGILLRLSDAAVAALGVRNEKFPVVVSYY